MAEHRFVSNDDIGRKTEWPVSAEVAKVPNMVSSLIIRLAGPVQVEQIRDLTVLAYTKWVPVTPRKPRPMTADYSASIRENRFDLLYEEEGLVGLIETVQQDDELMI